MKGQTTRKASRGRTPSGQPNPIDIHVGNRIRLRRTLLGLSQEKLAAMLGLTFQQVQKYECGENRLTVARLNDICRVFDVSPALFYNEANQSYVHDKNMVVLINTIYKLPTEKRNIIAVIANALCSDN